MTLQIVRPTHIDYFSIRFVSIELMGQQGILAHGNAGIVIADAWREVFVYLEKVVCY
jgi:hypothetical protein